jgi:hypothetical protein
MLKNVIEASVAGNDSGDKLHNAAQHHVKRVGGGNSAADLVHKINGGEAVAKTCHGWSERGHTLHTRVGLAFGILAFGDLARIRLRSGGGKLISSSA